MVLVKKKKNYLKNHETLLLLSELWSSNASKAGIILLIILVATSIYAVVTMPPEFIGVWESAAYWDENPYLVPPAWVCFFGSPCAKHYVEVKSKPDVAYSIMGVLYYNYTFSYELIEDVLPQDLMVKIIGLKVPIFEQKAVTPYITLTLSRPDGLTIMLSRLVVTVPPTANIRGNVTVKLGDIHAPIKLEIDPRSLSIRIFEYYNLHIPEDIIGKDESMQMLGKIIVLNRIEEVAKRHRQDLLFGYPIVTVNRKDQSKNIIKINNLIDTIIISISEENINIRNELLGIRETLEQICLSNKTLSDTVQLLKNVHEKVFNLWKTSFIEMSLSPDNLNKLYDIYSMLSIYLNQLTQTDAFFDVQLSTLPLKGQYQITVSIAYEARGILINTTGLLSPSDEVKVIIKGSAYGFLGTDDLGRDIAQLLLYGFPIALGIGAFSAIVTTAIGLILGIVSGYYGGWIDEVIQRTADIIGNIPWLPILIIIAQIAQQAFAIYPPATKAFLIMLTILFVLILTGWGGLAITVRAMVLSIKEEPYVEAAIALGASNRRVIVKHIAPQVAIYVVATLVSSIPSAILAEAGLSILGIRHGWPTWGSVLSRARDLGRYDIWWWIIPPGVLLAITSLTFIMLGFAIEKVVEPRLQTL
ncbi:MAG: ABC transporter permease [Candidatus Geothermarchaeota archaeon]